MTRLNNKKLKKLLKSKARVKIEQNPDMFYKEFLKSELFVPVIAIGDEESLEDGDTLDLQIGFFDEENGDRNIYLFTDTNELEKAGYIVGLSVDDACRASFSFTSRRIKELLTKAGEIVEIFVYCEALKTGFDDIRKGFGFSWYGSKVENELDIVLTKGFCSMIIEVKAVEKLDMNYYHKLHSLVSQFGIGAKAAIINNDYRKHSFYAENNTLQTERGDRLRIKTFSGREEIEDIGEGLARYIKS